MLEYKQYMRSLKISSFIIGICIGLLSCESNSDEVLPSDSFVKIYDDTRFSASYIPIDIIQTEDEGYLILSGTRQESSNFAGTYVMKVDSEGNYIANIRLPDTDVQPIANWIKQGNMYYFVCMDATNLGARLFSVDQQLNLSDPTSINATYPMSVSQVDNQMILLSYDNDSKNSELSLFDENGNISQFISFSIGIGEGIEEPIIDHFTRTGRQFPFQTGRAADGTYFFNGFYNYTLSLVFTDFSGDMPKGVVQGQQDDGGISAILPLSGSNFALSRFNFGDNYVVSQTQINTSDIISSTNLIGNSALEWAPDAHVDIKRINIPQLLDVIIYGSTTQNGQIMITIYDSSTGEWLGNKYLGFSTPYSIQGMIQTSDNGIAILGTTAVAGRFNRICLFKLSSKELIDISKQVQQ